VGQDFDKLELAREALTFIGPACAREPWIEIGQAIHSEWPGDEGLALWDSWSQGAPDQYQEAACRSAWRSFVQPPPIRPGEKDHHFRLGTIFFRAEREGWVDPRKDATAKGKRPHRKAAPPAPTPDDRPKPEPKAYPPEAELKALIALCGAVADDEQGLKWCQFRRLEASQIDERGDAWVLPAKAVKDAPRWLPSVPTTRRQRLHGRLLIPLYDAQGEMRSVTGRAIDPAPADGVSSMKMKASRPIKLYEGHPGFLARGLCMMNAAAYSLVTRAPEDKTTGVDVVIVEGEPDFLTRCQTTPGAAVIGIYSGSWQPEIAARIPDGARVYIETDRDKSGDHYAVKIGRSLNGRCPLFRLRADMPPGDVNDLHVRGQLRPPADQCAEWTPPADETRAPDFDGGAPSNQVTRVCGQWQLSYAMKVIWEHLTARNQAILEAAQIAPAREPLFLTPSNAELAHLAWREGADGGRQIEIERLSLAQVMHLLMSEFHWYTTDKNGEEHSKDPKRSVADLVLGAAAYAPEPLPVIHAVTRTPIYGRDGSPIHHRGYHASERLWYEPDDGMAKLPEIPQEPSAAFIARSKELLSEAIGDFPFCGEAERATAFAAILLPFVRRMIQGPTPIHLIEAPIMGSGKSLLARVISIIVTGSAPSPIILNDNAEETQKTLAAELSRGRPLIVIDNLDTSRLPLHSPALSMVATETTPAFRVFGKNTEMMELPNTALWIATGNNVKVSQDLIRRFVRCRLDPGDERPWMRPAVTFKHPNIAAWASEHRLQLVWAALVLCQAWIAKGRPSGSKTLGSYEQWSAVIGGIIETAGIPGFLANSEAFYGFSDGESDAWPPFILAWWWKHGDNPVATKDLNAVCEPECLMAATRGDKSELSQMQRLGRALQTNHERIIEGMKVCARKSPHSKAWEYYLEPIGEAPPTAAVKAPTDKPAAQTDLFGGNGGGDEAF
jgi:hypothetical protein